MGYWVHMLKPGSSVRRRCGVVVAASKTYLGDGALLKPLKPNMGEEGVLALGNWRSQSMFNICIAFGWSVVKSLWRRWVVKTADHNSSVFGRGIRDSRWLCCSCVNLVNIHVPVFRPARVGHEKARHERWFFQTRSMGLA